MKYTNVIKYNTKITLVDPDEPIFFVYGRGYRGCRFYSENLCYEDALAIMPKYVGTVEYFGGGTVELICSATGETIKIKEIF